MIRAAFRLLGRNQRAGFGNFSKKALSNNPTLNLIELIESKDAFISKLREENESLMDEANSIKIELTGLKIELQTQNIAYLKACNELNIRGGLNIVTHSIRLRHPNIPRGDPGFAYFLDNDPQFQQFFKAYLAKKNLHIEDLRDSFVSLWQDVKSERPCSEGFAIKIFDSDLSEKQIHCLCPLFDFFLIQYERINKAGKKYDFVD
jgi:hypothetical protein